MRTRKLQRDDKLDLNGSLMQNVSTEYDDAAHTELVDYMFQGKSIVITIRNELVHANIPS